jgi:tetratricopeptide (TPR) repeat protein
MVATAGIVFSLRFASAEALAVTDDIDKLKKATQTYPFEGTYAQRLSRKYRLQGEAFAREQKLPETRMSFRLALDQSQAALSRHPLDLTLMQTHQWNYYKMGVLLDKTYHQQSLSLAKTITQLAPSDPRSWDRLGLVYLDMGELDQAQTQFQTCLLLKPDYVGGLLHLGETFKQQGREELALPLYEQAAALSNSQIAQEELEKAKNDPDFSQK